MNFAAVASVLVVLAASCCATVVHGSETSPQLSSIVLPIEIPLSELAANIEKDVPKILAASDWDEEPEDVKLAIRRGPIQLQATGATLNVSLPLALHVESKKGGPRARRNPAVCDSNTTIRLSIALDVSYDWRLQSKTIVAPHRWSDPCEIGPRIKRTSLVEKMDEQLGPKFQSIAAKVDAKISQKADLGKKLAVAWTEMHQPMPVGDDGSLSMALNPQQIGFGPIEGTRDSLNLTFGILVRPELVAGKADVAPAGPLPSNTGVRSPDGFRLRVALDMPFSQMTQMMRKKMAGKSLGDKAVKVNDVRISGGVGKMLVELDVSGSIDATLRLRGVPLFDAKKQEIVIDDVGLTLETVSALAGNDAKQLREEVELSVAPELRFPLGEKITEITAKLNKSLNRELKPGVFMRGQVGDISPTDVEVTQSAFVASMVINADAWLVVFPGENP